MAGSEPLRLIYNLGNGVGFSVREIVEAVRRVTGHPIPVVEEPRRAGDPAVLIASSAKIARDLGWRPQYTRYGRNCAQCLGVAPGALRAHRVLKPEIENSCAAGATS